ncbi:lytic transglycosylase domain-containing protein [Pseudoduganella rivuli]
MLAFLTRHASACWSEAAASYGGSAALLQAIAWTESSMRKSAVNDSHFHITGTRDIGLMGINSAKSVLKRLGIHESDLFDSCTNIRIGARILAEKFARYGPTWEAVGAYNASCTKLAPRECQVTRSAYAWKVYRNMQRAKFEGASANSIVHKHRKFVLRHGEPLPPPTVVTLQP